MSGQPLVKECQGLQVSLTKGEPMGITVEPGMLRMEDGSEVRFQSPVRLAVRAPGSRRLCRQVYRINGEGEMSPCHWNGEHRRGSGGSPYQRMVPGTLEVLSADRSVLYEPGRDYVYDYYWGTIKRHSQGRIPQAADLSLDYEIWLCRYDAVVAGLNGSIYVLEGMTEAPESKELLLPEPPSAPADGYVLAHIFTGWGQNRLYDGQCRIVTGGLPQDCNPPALKGRYLDMTARRYFVEAVQDASDRSLISVRMAAAGEDYGTGDFLSGDSLRWTEPAVYPVNRPVPLLLRTAYGYEADWGLELDFSGFAAGSNKRSTFEVVAEPSMIFDMRNLPRDPQTVIPVDDGDGLRRFAAKLASPSPQTIRLVFYGESTTHAGRWPYQTANGLRRCYPRHQFLTANAGVPGEDSIQGYSRLRDEVLNHRPDLVFVEFLINDAFSGRMAEVEASLRKIVREIKAAGSDCVIVTGNGMNPQFAPNGSARMFAIFYDLYKKVAKEEKAAFIGTYEYFANLHSFGKYFITELKGNMVNHPYGNVDPDWAPLDGEISRAVLRCLQAQ